MMETEKTHFRSQQRVIPETVNPTNDSGSLKNQLKSLLEHVTLSENDLIIRKKIADIIQNSLRRTYPNCKIYLFGSTLTSLGDKKSNVDIFVDMYGTSLAGNSFPAYFVPPWADYISNILSRATNPVTQERVCNLVKLVSNTRVPFLSAEFHINGHKITCELSFMSILQVRNSELICFYMTLDPRVRPLLRLIRYWAKFHGLALKNYILDLLVLVFLARKNIVPRVKELQRLNSAPITVGLWNVAFCNDKAKLKKYCTYDSSNKDLGFSVLKLAEAFFKEMTQIDLQTNVICSLTAEIIPKTEFFKLPKKVYRCFRSKTGLIIQDPLDLSNNVGNCTTNEVLQNFLKACKQTSEILKIMFASRPITLTDMFKCFSEESPTNALVDKVNQKERTLKSKESGLFQISFTGGPDFIQMIENAFIDKEKQIKGS